MVADFNAGIAMTLIHNLGSYENQRQTFTPDQYAFVPFPAAVNGQLTTIVPTCKGIAASATTKYPDEAWEYLKWNASEDAISSLNEAVGELPTRIDSSSHQWVKDAPHMSNLPAFVNADKLSVLIPVYLPDYSTIQKQVCEPAFQAVLAGDKTVDEFMDEWATAMEAGYAEYMQAKSAS
jgi:multiple sugar transport system substrate-binding protein